jgi:predicted  nucleic acid-binding Zn-ribbon protein
VKSTDYPITQAARDAYRQAANRQFRRFLDVSAENAELRTELEDARRSSSTHDATVFANLRDERDRLVQERDELKAQVAAATQELAQARATIAARVDAVAFTDHSEEVAKLRAHLATDAAHEGVAAAYHGRLAAWRKLVEEIVGAGAKS